MDPGQAEALANRIRSQGWRQGSKLPGRHDLFLANPNRPITEEARRLGDGGATAVVHAEWPDEPAMVVVSQDCDLVADPRIEPLVEAIPVVRIGEDDPLPAANSARYFTLDPEKRLVADLTRRLELEKSLLPDRDAEHYFEPGAVAESFRAVRPALFAGSAARRLQPGGRWIPRSGLEEGRSGRGRPSAGDVSVACLDGKGGRRHRHVIPDPVRRRRREQG